VGRRRLVSVPNETESGTPGASRECVWRLFSAPVGPLMLAATADGLVQVAFHADGRTVRHTLSALRARTGREPSQVPERRPAAPGTADGPCAHLATAERELTEYFAGTLRTFTVPLDWAMTGGFHERVLRELAVGVPYGATAGYQDLADRVGEPGAARAVGVAMGANPLPVVVPCHRVVERGGGLGGFGGGLETKRELLALEGVLPRPLF
jgi:methylated-DNA-[protein]-cysteine S-methyltransferase